MQTEGGSSAHVPIEFVARRAASRRRRPVADEAAARRQRPYTAAMSRAKPMPAVSRTTLEEDARQEGRAFVALVDGRF